MALVVFLLSGFRDSVTTLHAARYAVHNIYLSFIPLNEYCIICAVIICFLVYIYLNVAPVVTYHV